MCQKFVISGMFAFLIFVASHANASFVVPGTLYGTGTYDDGTLRSNDDSIHFSWNPPQVGAVSFEGFSEQQQVMYLNLNLAFESDTDLLIQGGVLTEGPSLPASQPSTPSFLFSDQFLATDDGPISINVTAFVNDHLGEILVFTLSDVFASSGSVVGAPTLSPIAVPEPSLAPLWILGSAGVGICCVIGRRNR